MRKSLSIALFLLGLAVGALWSPSFAVDGPTPKAPEPGLTSSKIAVVDLNDVFSKYEKVKTLKVNTDKLVESFKKAEDQLKKQGTDLKNQLEDKGVEEAKRKKIDEDLKQIERKLEDNREEWDKKIREASGQQMAELYREVIDVVQTFAEAKGYDLVLAFGEPAGSERFSVSNAARKVVSIEQGGTVPVYIHHGTKITRSIVEILNKKAKSGETRD